MFILMAELKAKEGKAEAAKELLRKLVQTVKASEPGTLIYTVYQRKDDPLTFIVFEQYKDEAAFQTHKANLAQHGASFADILDGGPKATFLEAI